MGQSGVMYSLFFLAALTASGLAAAPLPVSESAARLCYNRVETREKVAPPMACANRWSCCGRPPLSLEPIRSMRASVAPGTNSCMKCLCCGATAGWSGLSSMQHRGRG